MRNETGASGQTRITGGGKDGGFDLWIFLCGSIKEKSGKKRRPNKRGEEKRGEGPVKKLGSPPGKQQRKPV